MAVTATNDGGPADLQEDIAKEAELQRDDQLQATNAVVNQLRRLGFLLTVDATAIIAAILFGPH